MASVAPLIAYPASRRQPEPCCLTQRHDAVALASAAAPVVRPGAILDIGSGTGTVAIRLLQARPDVRVVGIEVARDRTLEALRRARIMGISERLRVVHGDALTAPLPDVASVVANPPLLPTEPWFVAPAPDGGEEPFAHAMLRRLASRRRLTDVWFHVFDFQGVDQPSGPFPSLAQVAWDLGFEAAYPHSGWRSVGPTSAIRDALPQLVRMFPDAFALADGREVRFRDLGPNAPDDLAIRHSIVRLSRPAAG